MTRIGACICCGDVHRKRARQSRLWDSGHYSQVVDPLPAETGWGWDSSELGLPDNSSSGGAMLKTVLGSLLCVCVACAMAHADTPTTAPATQPSAEQVEALLRAVG